MKSSSDKANKRANKRKLNNAAEKISDLSSVELEQYIKDCENKYHEAFKRDSCFDIMRYYHMWQNAKRKYYTLTDNEEQNDTQDDITINCDEVDEIETEF